jgi:hypothetical protein
MAQEIWIGGSKGSGPLIEIVPPTAAKKYRFIYRFSYIYWLFISHYSHSQSQRQAKQNQSHKKKAKEDL